MTRGVAYAILALGAACAASPSAGPRPVTIAAILGSTALRDGTTIVVEGRYRGWHPDASSAAAAHGPPVTRSDWALDDGTGTVYVTGRASGLDATHDVGAMIRVTGTLRRTRTGQPYVEATRTERLGE